MINIGFFLRFFCESGPWRGLVIDILIYHLCHCQKIFFSSSFEMVFSWSLIPHFTSLQPVIHLGFLKVIYNEN